MKTSFFYLLISAFAFTACGDKPEANNETTIKADSATAGSSATVNIKEGDVTYQSDTSNLIGYVAYDQGSSDKRPAVLVVGEWWGVTEYPKMRAHQLAELGYVAMVVDFFGNGKVATNPDEAKQFTAPYYKNPALAKSRVDAALAKLKTYDVVDTSNIAAIGYCFGGSMVLNAAKLGENLKGVVSFHGGLAGVPAKKALLKASVLVCHGEADSFVPKTEVDQFRKSMESIGADYTFKSYPNATHAFTNPKADENAKKFQMPISYNAAADTASWNDMKTFFTRIFSK